MTAGQVNNPIAEQNDSHDQAAVSRYQLSVVIPNLHSPIIDRVLAALLAQTITPDEIIVVGQDRYERIPQHPLIRSIVTEKPRSAAAGRNIGAQAAQGKWLLFIDSDCIAAPDLVERMRVALQAEPRAVIGGGVKLEPAPYWTLCDNLLVFAPVFDSTPAGTRPYLPSLNLAISRELFLAQEGFDERFPGAAGEDTDFCLRLARQGIAILFEPRAVISHQPPRQSPRAMWEHLRRFGRAHVTVRRRNGSPNWGTQLYGWLWLLLALAPLLAGIDAIRLLIQQQAFRRYPSTLAGVWFGKIAWYWGVAEALGVGQIPLLSANKTGNRGSKDIQQ